jgi:uncharacterized protein YbjT (DUF2867 family)
MILITGATGNIGRHLVRELDARGIEQRLLVRDPKRANRLPARARRVVGDLAVPATLAPAFDGIATLFLLTQGIGTDQAANAIAAATAADVRHIVFISSYSVLTEPLPAMARWHHAREALVRASGIPATILRPTGFMTNAFEWLPTIAEGGFVIDAVGPGRLAPIDPADIAAVAAHVLTTPGHEGKAYAPTGGESFTIAEQVHILAAAVGRPLEVRAAGSLDEAVRSRFPNGAPPELAAAIIEGLRLMREDTAGFRTDTVKELLGRAPATFAAWCARNAAVFQRAADEAA